jgi:hypothetical protein
MAALRVGALIALLGVALLSCSTFDSSARSSPNPTPSSPALSQAADLRTHLNLLFGEHIYIVAKESEAAVDHAGEYTSYANLLATNTRDLTSLMGRAFGNTTATQFSQAWTAYNGYLADYTIGVVTHDQEKANVAMSGLSNQSLPQLAQLITTATQIPLNQITESLKNQLTATKELIDDEFAAQSAMTYSVTYGELHSAYTIASGLGNTLALRISQQFPDKFPGDPSAKVVNLRASLNNVLQECAYLATMATDAAVNGRNAEVAQALSSISANTDLMGMELKNPRLKSIWALEVSAIESYAATGDPASKKTLTETFVSQLSSITATPESVISDQVTATIRAIDDQRAGSLTSLAGDDRAAATAMQPIADSLAGSSKG